MAGVLVLNALQHLAGKKASATLPVDAVMRGEVSWMQAGILLVGNPWVLLTGFSLLLGFLLWMRVLTAVPLGVAVPLLSLNYVVIALAGTVLFQEPLSWTRGVGIGLVMAGVWCITREGGFR
jgi:undecaprenyl phosphate-alpha-L-ara4N flippase subunit ArnE